MTDSQVSVAVEDAPITAAGPFVSNDPVPITIKETEVDGDNEQTPHTSKARKELLNPTREPGKSLLPFARVQKVIKADKDIPIVAKEAVFLISLATEEFITRIAAASQKVASREKRSTVQHKDLAIVVRKVDEFVFLEELMPWLSTTVVAQRKTKTTNENVQESATAPTMLDKYTAMPSKTANDDSRVTDVASDDEIEADE